MPTPTNRDNPQSWLLSAVDRSFDLAEQALAAQRQFALALAGAAARQADIAADTVAETIDAPVEAAATTVEAAATTVEALEDEAPRQDRRFDGRTYEERTVEELRERAATLQIEGRSSMSKDELITALRSHRTSRSARNDTPQNDTPDRRPYEDRSVEELRERASELEIEGRSSMSKDQLIAALRKASR